MTLSSLSYDPYGPARNFLGKPYEKKSRMRAVRLTLAGPEKAVWPYQKSVWPRYCHKMTGLEPVDSTALNSDER